MSNPKNDSLLQVETTCESILYELQIIWDEVGESSADRDRMLFELEQECLEVYRRKVDHENRNRALLRQAIADCEAELATICSTMGELPVHTRQANQNAGSLKEEHQRILSQLEEMQRRKLDRRTQFVEVCDEIQKISKEIHGSADQVPIDETDLSLRKLEELHRQLHTLQKEKSDRLRQVQEHVDALNSLCSVLDLDFKHILSEVHPSFVEGGPRDKTNDTIQHLAAARQKLREVKIQRMEKLQDLVTTMLELWNLMDTPIEEQEMFQNVTCNIAASEQEITDPNSLSMKFIDYVEAEVARLEQLKSSKMKELVLRKRSELEELCRKTHMIPETDTATEYAIEAIDSGNVDPASVLQQIELHIANVKEEALSRKEVLEKVEKWLAVCEEECWLEEYNRDENRYNSGKGTHLILKRAERARSLVNKLPDMAEKLAFKTMAWEKERGIEFLYDGTRLLSMLEEYTILRQKKEEEKKRQRDQKKLQGQLIAEQEILYGSKPSPSKLPSFKKTSRVSTGGASSKKLSLGGATPDTRPGNKIDKMHLNDRSVLHNDDGFSVLSAGKKGLDIAGLPVKQHSFGVINSHEPESPMLRKPFSPISSTASSRANMLDKTPTGHGEILKKKLAMKDHACATPLKAQAVAHEENRTPKTMPIAVPTTPLTVSVPMQTIITPASLPAIAGANRAEDIPEDVEYSFEERRAGFVLPKTHIRFC